ncbi:hypothetical protein B0H16DRAFT_1467207 [Mycena metata]|uniref:Uncharacterized protein n=1 Tax=Mycena metata TaxID=1033252 RepID=A0AAD7MW86_9AGAR|nr:hypothetical protein B0H16DRAFT_1467207 [Mycena metata]
MTILMVVLNLCLHHGHHALTLFRRHRSNNNIQTHCAVTHLGGASMQAGTFTKLYGSVAKQEHTDKITVDEAPETESEWEETLESEPIPEKGYGLSMELVGFEDLNYNNEIFGIPEDQEEQTFGQESVEGNNSEVSEEEITELKSTLESPIKAQLQEWLDTLEQITFGSQAGDTEVGNLLRQRLAKLEQKVL